MAAQFSKWDYIRTLKIELFESLPIFEKNKNF